MENVAFESTMPFNGYESDSAGWPWLERSETPGVLQRGMPNRPGLPSLRFVQPRPPVWMSRRHGTSRAVSPLARVKRKLPRDRTTTTAY